MTSSFKWVTAATAASYLAMLLRDLEELASDDACPPDIAEQLDTAALYVRMGLTLTLALPPTFRDDSSVGAIS